MSTNNTGFKFNYILWMNDWELARLIVMVPKRDSTNFCGAVELQILAEACLGAHELVVYRICRVLSKTDAQVFHTLLHSLNGLSQEQQLQSKRIVENLVDELFLSDEIGRWWQPYAM